MSFRVVSAYHARGKRIEPGGDPVELDARDAERLTRLGCVVAIAGEAITEPAPAIDEPTGEADEAEAIVGVETERTSRRRGRR